jgi:hypothetical protein
MTVNREQAVFIAELVHTIRPAWDTRAILAALKATEHRDLADVAHAAIRIAQDDKIRKPIVISMDGEHWRPTIRDDASVRPTSRDQCTKPGHSSWATNCAQCRSEAIAIKEEA